MESPLTAAVRASVRSYYAPMVGRRRHATSETIERLIEGKTEEALAVLRETHAEDAAPTEDDLLRASLETSHRTIKALIPKMRDPSTQDPWRREILNDLADGAEASLARRRALGIHATEEERAEMTKDIVERFRALTDKVEAGCPPAEPPAPQ